MFCPALCLYTTSAAQFGNHINMEVLDMAESPITLVANHQFHNTGLVRTCSKEELPR